MLILYYKLQIIIVYLPQYDYNFFGFPTNTRLYRVLRQRRQHSRAHSSKQFPLYVIFQSCNIIYGYNEICQTQFQTHFLVPFYCVDQNVWQEKRKTRFCYFLNSLGNISDRSNCCTMPIKKKKKLLYDELQHRTFLLIFGSQRMDLDQL